MSQKNESRVKRDQQVKFIGRDDSLDDYEEEGNCGFSTCEPSCLQRCNNVRVMTMFQCLFAFFEGFVVNGVINVIIIALETRYRLSSKLTGLIASGNDWGAFFVLLFIGHFAENRNKPKVMAAGVVCMAVGCLIFSLPHFIGGEYKYVKSDPGGPTDGPGNLCLNETEAPSNGTCLLEHTEEGNEVYFALFLIGQVFLGIGSSPMFTIGLTYLDENSKAKMTSFYTGLVMFSAAIGVAAGYIMAGYSLSVYVDVDKVDVESIALTPMDPRWVGAWWIGIVAGLFAFIFITVPFCAFPKRLPNYNRLKKTRTSETHGDTDIQVHSGQYKGNLRDFPKALFRLMKNPTFVLLCLAGSCEALIIAGTATFGAKLLHLFFHVDFMKAGMLMGIITVPGAGGGMILGGYLVKKLNLTCVGIIKLCGIVTFLALLLTPAFLARCPERKIAGITSPYTGEKGVQSLMSTCNEHCSCSTEGMEPMCVGGQLTFFSPCHAGCSSSVVIGNGTKEFQDCSCIDDYTLTLDLSRQSTALYNETDSSSSLINNLTYNSNAPPTSSQPVNNTDHYIMPGMCAADCEWLYVFCVLCFFIMLCTFCTMTPNITAVMRCVQRDERSLAVGLQILSARLLGTTPGPVLFGAILDSTCLTWQEGCSGKGSCWVYETESVSSRVIIWWVSIKAAAVLIYFIASRVYKPPSGSSQTGERSDILMT